MEWSLVALLICFARGGYGQAFNSGSTGADGPLNLTTAGTINFDPVALGLHPTIPNVFNFTTINIANGVTVKLTSKTLSGPVYWLAQGVVTINGTVDLSGEGGANPSNTISTRVPAAGGAGGYSGGVGGALVSGSPNLPAPEPGNGPGAGIAPTTATGTNAKGGDGTFVGSQYLIPLIGGSGGAGGSYGTAPDGTFGGGGGGGGGAILIASSVSITLGGTIIASGGAGGGSLSDAGGNGSGGAVRLMAPAIFDSQSGGGGGTCGPDFGRVHGSIVATGSAGNGGVIRLEAFSTTIALSLGCVSPPPIQSTPFNVVPPASGPSSLTVTSINGVSINANPFSFPDATINAPGPVTVNVQAQYIPLGTVPKITVMSETGPDQNINCSALQGTLQQSTCSAQITFPTGGSRGFVKATWTQ